MFYVLIILVVIALFREIPYRLFRESHKTFPVVFLIAAYHGATAPLKERWFDNPAGYILLLTLIAVGVVAALIGLFQQIGASRKTTAIIDQIEQHESGILDIQLTTPQKPFFHQPGQYASLRFAHDNEPHPFTIASSGDGTRLRFAIKELGYATTGLGYRLQVGQPVTVEGPYGAFDFNGPGDRQVWVAGGIEITPFLARLDFLAHHGGTQQPIDFWYSTRSDEDTLFPASLAETCQQSGVNFYHLNSTKNGYLTADQIQAVVGSLYAVSIWFCGPPAFAQCLLKGLNTYGFDKRHFHYDDFDMR